MNHNSNTTLSSSALPEHLFILFAACNLYFSDTVLQPYYGMLFILKCTDKTSIVQSLQPLHENAPLKMLKKKKNVNANF